MQRTKDVTDVAGLTPERYDLLLMIAAADGGVRITDLCESLQLRQTAVSELVKRAADAGLVLKETATDDRRAVSLRLTAEGSRRLMRAFRALDADRETLASTFGAANRRLASAGQQA